MAKTNAELKFDPGFAPYILAFQGTVDYLYADINRFKNLSQKKVKFLQYHKKILDIFYNNIGFYVGCLMWAAYLKAQPKGEIVSNPCLNAEYIESENTADTQFMLKFAELFPKDMKYFLGKEFEFDSNINKLIKIYEEFLILNKGFTETKFNSDLVLPDKIKIDNVDKCRELINSAIEQGDLALLTKDIKLIIR